MCGKQISADFAASAGELIDGIPGVGEVKKAYSTFFPVIHISGTSISMDSCQF